MRVNSTMETTFIVVGTILALPGILVTICMVTLAMPVILLLAGVFWIANIISNRKPQEEYTGNVEPLKLPKPLEVTLNFIARLIVCILVMAIFLVAFINLPVGIALMIFAAMIGYSISEAQKKKKEANMT